MSLMGQQKSNLNDIMTVDLAANVAHSVIMAKLIYMSSIQDGTVLQNKYHHSSPTQVSVMLC